MLSMLAVFYANICSVFFGGVAGVSPAEGVARNEVRAQGETYPSLIKKIFLVKKKVGAYNKSMSFLPKEFSQFISPDAQRREFICSWLEQHGVKAVVASIDGKNHILVQFPPSSYNPQFKIKTVIAHYDRVENSPGANDNSAADWQIMNWAVELYNMQGFHNVRIFFTDGEELGWNTGVSEQGAFGIANVFKRLGITNDDVYVFDSCGRGEIPVLANTEIPAKAPKAFSSRFSDLFERTQEILRRSSPGRWMCLPVPYSDNAAFLACGIPAVAITMLPAKEASLYARELNQHPDLKNAVMNRESSKKERLSSGEKEYAYKERMPYTWRLFHTAYDNEDSLTPESFRVMQNILRTIALSKTPL